MVLLTAFLALACSILVITYGAAFLTDGASSIAAKLRISPLVVGLTVVALGTSAPEFTVSLSAVLEGHSAISLGNVVGTNIMNIFVILGITALITPLRLAKSTERREIPFLVFITFIFFLLARDSGLPPSPEDIITRWDGLILLLLFLGFIVYNIYMARRSSQAENVELDIHIPMLSWWISVVLFLVGLGMLVLAVDVFTNNAVIIAKELGLSETVIGLTIVALGTSVPEFATTLVAARRGQVDIAVGNIVGSNIFNILLIVGLVAVIKPIDSRFISDIDFIVMVFSTLLLFLFARFYKRAYHYSY